MRHSPHSFQELIWESTSILILNDRFETQNHVHKSFEGPKPTLRATNLASQVPRSTLLDPWDPQLIYTFLFVQ